MPKQKVPRKKAPRVPSLRHCNGRGFVELSGRRVYLGSWGAPETEETYQRKIAEWLEAGRNLPIGAHESTVAELCDRFLQHAQLHYRKPDGTETTSMDGIREAIRVLRRLYGRTLVKDFGPLAFRAVRQQWIDRSLARKTANAYARYVRQIFKWGVSHELVPAKVHSALTTVEGLRRGRSEARETEAVKPVSAKSIDAVLPHVARQVAALIELQRLTAARAGEIVGLRPCDIDVSGDVWTATIAEHKTAHLEKTRTLFLGPRAQALLRPFMLRPADAPMFSPQEAEAERHAKAESHRRPGQKPNKRKTTRRVGIQYTVDSYRRAIERGCEEANRYSIENGCEDGKIEVWTPHQLRHTAATAIRKQFGLEAAQVVLGHAHANVTEIYAEADVDKAAQIAREVG